MSTAPTSLRLRSITDDDYPAMIAATRADRETSVQMALDLSPPTAPSAAPQR